MNETSLSSLIQKTYQVIVDNLRLFIYSMLIALLAGVLFYFLQPKVFISSALVHSKIFPFETVTNALEPIVIDVKNDRFEELSKLIGIPEEKLSQVRKIELLKVKEMQDKVVFDKVLFKLIIRSKSDSKQDADLLFSTIVKRLNEDKFIAEQLEIEKEAINKHINQLDRTISNLDTIETDMRRRMKNLSSVDFEVGKVYENYAGLLTQKEQLDKEYKRLNNGFDILSASDLYKATGFTFWLCMLISFFVGILLFYLIITIKKR